MSTKPEKSSMKRQLLKAGVVIAVAAAFFLAGAGLTQAVGWQGHGMFHGQGVHQAMMKAGIEAHVTEVLKQLDATPDQKAQIQTILDRFFNEHEAFAADHKALHERAVGILTAPTIDREALEQVRKDGMQKVDVISSQIADVLADVAEVLTPAQRQQLKLLMEEHFK